MKGLKMTAKRILTGVLTAAMIVTSVNLPGMTSSVQAATVYNDTTTALSSLAGSTGLKMYELTSSDAGAQLSSGMYYINSDLTLNEDKSHYNGLKIAENATAYIYIPEGTTLTVYGQDGTNAANGGNATEPSFTFFITLKKELSIELLIRKHMERLEQAEVEQQEAVQRFMCQPVQNLFCLVEEP